MAKAIPSKIGGILAGFVTWLAVTLAFGLVARSLWPAYAAAEKQYGFNLTMQIARLFVGVVATISAGAAAGWFSKGENKIPLWFGTLLLIISTVRHYQLWDKFPIWYHLFFLASLVPLSILGGRLIKSASQR